VNGSDPRLQQQLFEFKRDMGLLTEEEADEVKKTEAEMKKLKEHNSQTEQREEPMPMHHRRWLITMRPCVYLLCCVQRMCPVLPAS